MYWVYGVTTVPLRMHTLLPKTLESLERAGFYEPRIFVDGIKDTKEYEEKFHARDRVVARWPVIRTYPHWVLSLAEMYLREPLADRYAIFQDDFVTYKNLRKYLDRIPYPDKGYWNLYTFPSNQTLVPKCGNSNKEYTGWYDSNQLGRGAVALVFDKPTVVALITHQHMVERVTNAHRGHKSVDGGVVTALRQIGYKEYVHNPSLVQHTGTISSMGNRPHKLATSFRGEDYDALKLLETIP